MCDTESLTHAAAPRIAGNAYVFSRWHRRALEWPKILPMWWGYKNPVPGREPELFLPDCVPCDYAPEMSMTKHGYLLPTTDPVRSVD